MDENKFETTPEQTPFRDQEYTDAFGEGEDLERMFSDEPYEAEVPEAPETETQEEEPMPERKGRPKRKKGAGLLGIPHILVTAVWLAIVVMIGVSLGRVAWVCVSDVLAFGREDQEIAVSIDDEDTIEDIAGKLQEAGLIRYTQLFELYAELTDAREDISAGTFTLNTLYDYNALVKSMTTYSSLREEVKVTIPEGFNCRQLFELLEENGVATVRELEDYAANGELDEYWFLADVERGESNCLEGFLFPDTYNFYMNDDPRAVLEKMLDNFDYRVDEDLRAKIDTLNEWFAGKMRNHGYDDAYIAEHKLNWSQVITVASMIEEETANVQESFTISSVIYNRLANAKSWPYLNIDATLLYAIGHTDELTAEDLQTDTPYNTYLYKGLTPGPITNPGLDSIKAALDPEDTGYYLYVLNPETGTHKFSKTMEEHEAYIAGLS